MKNFITKASLLKFLILGIIFIPLVSFAESQILIQESEIDVEVIPENPQPYEEVTIIVNSYATDLDRAIISWQGSSGTVLSGIGKTSYTFTAPGPNDSVYFDIVISPVGEMNTIKKRIVINPSDMDIMWESVDGYTPPFYKGKSLPANGSIIRVVAIPNTNTIRSGNGSIDYTWKKDDKTIQEASGYNKNSYVFKNGLLDLTNNLSVTASSVEGNYGAEKEVSIPLFDPKLIFYKRSPNEGILYNNALNKEFFMSEDEATVVAEPYYLSIKNNQNLFSYDWKINGQGISTPTKKTELTISPTSRDGYATIDFAIESISGLFQVAKNSLKITL